MDGSFRAKRSSRTVAYLRLERFYSSVKAAGPEVVVVKAGKVLDMSRAAEAKGVTVGSSVRQALYCCPNATVVEYVPDDYAPFSEAAWSICYRYTPLVEPVSDFECFLDFTGCEAATGLSPGAAVDAIAREIERAIGVKVSACLGPSKLIARAAYRRPDASAQARVQKRGAACGASSPYGQEVCRRNVLDVDPAEFLGQMPTSALKVLFRILHSERGQAHGSRPSSAKSAGAVFEVPDADAAVDKLIRLGFKRIKEIASTPCDTLTQLIGPAAIHIHRIAQGIDSSKVIPGYPPEAITVRIAAASVQGDLPGRPIISDAEEPWLGASEARNDQVLRESSSLTRYGNSGCGGLSPADGDLNLASLVRSCCSELARRLSALRLGCSQLTVSVERDSSPAVHASPKATKKPLFEAEDIFAAVWPLITKEEVQQESFGGVPASAISITAARLVPLRAAQPSLAGVSGGTSGHSLPELSGSRSHAGPAAAKLQGLPAAAARGTSIVASSPAAAAGGSSMPAGGAAATPSGSAMAACGPYGASAARDLLIERAISNISLRYGSLALHPASALIRRRRDRVRLMAGNM